jgi:hypothetical protein
MLGSSRVVYTVVTANYDVLKSPRIVDADVDYIAYTDIPDHPPVGPWRFVLIENCNQRNPRVTSRWYKLLPHRHLADYGRSLWVDASFELVGSVSDFIDRFETLGPLVAFRHCERNCLYAEAEMVKSLGYEDRHIVDLQMEYYRSLGYPPENGLTETGVLLRHHHDPATQSVMESWWKQVELFSQRDQLSANFIFWKHHFPPAMLEFTQRQNVWFSFHHHPRTNSYVGQENTGNPANWLRQHYTESRQSLETLAAERQHLSESFNLAVRNRDQMLAEFVSVKDRLATERDRWAKERAAIVRSRSWRLTSSMRWAAFHLRQAAAWMRANGHR